MGTHGRCRPVVLSFPEQLAEESGPEPMEDIPASTQADKAVQPSEAKTESLVPDGAVPANKMRSWDIDFLEWDAVEDELEQRQELESSLFKPDPVMDEMRI